MDLINYYTLIDNTETIKAYDLNSMPSDADKYYINFSTPKFLNKEHYKVLKIETDDRNFFLINVKVTTYLPYFYAEEDCSPVTCSYTATCDAIYLYPKEIKTLKYNFKGEIYDIRL